MIALTSVALLCFTVLFIWRSAQPLLQKKLAQDAERIALERVRVENEKLSLLKPAITDDDPMPQDMIEWAMQETFDWARDDKIARMRELYGKLHDWKKVRSVLMAEEEAAVKQTF